MDRREALGVGVGVGLAGLAAMSGAAYAQESERKRFQYQSKLDKMHVNCLDACTACAAVCNEASHHCLMEVAKGSSDKEHHRRAHHLTMDCAEMCGVAAALIARQSPLMDAQCNACAEACKRCAEECEKGRDTGQIMKECARICRECERSCREMSRAMASPR